MSTPEEDAYLRTAFLARIAHELRGPSTVLQGSIAELEQAMGGDDVERQRMLLAMARRGVARVLRTAERLEQTAQLEDGTAQFNRESSDLVEVVKLAVTSAEALEARRTITVKVDLPEVPVMWKLDAKWMGFAVSELASNAIRHARKHVEVRVIVSEEALRIDFDDDNDASDAFAPIRFLPPRERRGLGLGLAITRDVVAAHRGRLDIEIGNGGEGTRRGARVSVTLPRESGPGLEQEAREH